MTEHAHLRSILCSSSNFHGRFEMELGITRISVVNRCERRHHARLQARDNLGTLRGGERCNPFCLFDLRGNRKIRLATVATRCNRLSIHETKPHATFLRLNCNNTSSKNHFTGKRKLPEKGSSQNSDALQGPGWTRIGSRIRCANGRTSQSVYDRVKQHQTVSMIWKLKRPGDAKGNAQAEGGVDGITGAINVIDQHAGKRRARRAILLESASGYQRRVKQSQTLHLAGHMNTAFDQQSTKRQL